MRNQKQNGRIVRIGDRWYVRYWERRNHGGTIERKRVTHQLGEVTTRGKNPPADIKQEAERHMSKIRGAAIPAERILTLGDFVTDVYLPWVEQHKRPSTFKGYRDVWEDHLKALCEHNWLKEVRTYTVQGWLNEIGNKGLSRNSLRHVKSIVSGIFTLAKRQDYFDGERILPATQESILRLRSHKKPMLTRWRKCRSYFRCCRNPLRRHSLWLRSWVCVTARFKDCCGRIFATARCTCPAQFGTGM
jgi:hypothetical protein